RTNRSDNRSPCTIYSAGHTDGDALDTCSPCRWSGKYLTCVGHLGHPFRKIGKLAETISHLPHCLSQEMHRQAMWGQAKHCFMSVKASTSARKQSDDGLSPTAEGKQAGCTQRISGRPWSKAHSSVYTAL